jgi:hypothetical protein
MVRIRGVLGLMAVLGLIAVSERDADACGGCFAPPSETSVVTDHRMAFQISTQQTVLWDQIRYSGDPKEFAWVLPVRPGTVVEPSTDAWFATLEAMTVPKIVGPTPSGGGCGFGGCSSASSAKYEDNGGGVTVVSQSVVGPYESVTLRSSDPNALETWLKNAGYAIPQAVQPTIAAYVSEKFDFIALKLRPGQGVRAMRPVRVVFSGSDNSLPLRMVAAGVGAEVAITLFVIGEGRYQAQNFPNTLVNDNDLVWDYAQNRSNYAEISLAAMAANDGKTWLTEFAKRMTLSTLDNFYVSNGSFGGTQMGYKGLCEDELGDAGLLSPFKDASPIDANNSNDASDDGQADAEPDASDDASSDASADDAASEGGMSGVGVMCDDIDVASRFLHPNDTWITRLRGNLPVAALSADLKLEAAEQSTVDNLHTISTNPQARGGSGCVAAPLLGNGADEIGTGAEIGACLFAVAALLRRRAKTDGEA